MLTGWGTEYRLDGVQDDRMGYIDRAIYYRTPSGSEIGDVYVDLDKAQHAVARALFA